VRIRVFASFGHVFGVFFEGSPQFTIGYKGILEKGFRKWFKKVVRK